MRTSRAMTITLELLIMRTNNNNNDNNKKTIETNLAHVGRK